MKYSSLIDNVTSKEWGLTIQLAYLFDWVYSLPSWAASAMIEGREYFFASKTKAVEELPLLTDKVDTMYRYYRSLEEMGLIDLKKVDGKDYICLTEKAKNWGRKSEYSENFPDLLGKKSENHSDLNPTYKTIRKDKRIRGLRGPVFLEVGAALEFKSQIFLNAWQEWVQYRKEKKHGLTSTTAKKQLKKLAQYPDDEAIEMLEVAMEKGWLGFFPLNDKNQSTQTSFVQ